ncbi:MAG: membrane protein insertase YidC [Terriglobia bacterium]
MDLDTEKRVFIAFVLMFGVFLLWRAFLWHPPPPPPSEHSKAQTQTTATVHVRPHHAPAPIQKAPPSVKLPVVQGSKAEDISIQNNDYRVTFSTQGAVIKSWILRKYTDAKNRPLDVVNQSACQQLGYPLSLEMADSSLAAKLNSAIYSVQPSGTNLTAPQEVTFTYSNGKDRVRKEFSFGKGYAIQVKVSVFDGQHDVPVAVEWPGGVGDQSLSVSSRRKHSLAFYNQEDGIKTVAGKKVNESRMIPGPLTSAGLEDLYFAGVFFPGSPQDAFHFRRESWMPAGAKDHKPIEALTAVLATPEAGPLSFRLFIAPKVVDVLKAESPGLENLVDFGVFSVLAKPTFLGMRWIYDHTVQNWGWAIIILTILINMAFFPLKLKSIRSAQAMQKVAPIVKEIQGRYKQYKFNDPRKARMNQEVMKVYQENGVNPLGGCLPMLVQLPIIYAFYEVLEASIAMRHAPWIWWIKDLSVPDPLYILPSLAIVLSFIMQKMTPMPSVDPAQQRMMMIAPLFVGFIFFYEAAGLTLYYFVYCLVAVGQQLLINRIAPPQRPSTPAASAAPAAASGRAPAPGRRKTVTVKG